MSIIPNKISVYGDSVALGLAARIAQHPAFCGFNDYARGGNSLAANLAGDCAGPLFGGLTFAEHIATVDDADIVVLHLGGNDQMTARTGAALGPGAVPLDFIGSDGLQIAADALVHIQHAKAAGKRVVVCGIPYLDPVKLQSVMGLTPDQVDGIVVRAVTINMGLRCVVGLTGVCFVATYGAPVSAGQPIPGADSTVDGVHPSPAYADAVGAFLANHIAQHFNI